MNAELEELRPKLKEILYDCAVEIRATKAALYLSDSADKFELFTEYGFRGNVRPAADLNDPIVDRCGRGRVAFFINGLAVEPRFSPLLFEASTDRLLVAPVYGRGKLVGFIDMRDKPAQAPFDSADAKKAQLIADRMAEVFKEKNLFGHRFIALSKLSDAHPAVGVESSPAPAVPAAPTQPSQPAPLPSVVRQPPPPAFVNPAAPTLSTVSEPRTVNLGALLGEARTIARRVAATPVQQPLTETEVAAAKDVLRSVLLLPGAVVASFSAFGHLGGRQEIAARSTLGDDAKYLVQAKVDAWLAKRGEPVSALRTTVHTPLGTAAPPVTAADVQKVFTAPLSVGSLRGLYLTVVFSETPDRIAHELLAVLHAHLQLVVEHSIDRRALREVRLRTAEKIVEPDFAKFPELRRHTDAVAALTEQFARALTLSPAEIEDAKIVALVHDAGMRLLDYEHLYRKPEPTEEDLGLLRQHPVVGAAMVEPLLGAEIARAVLCHHERADGMGYPSAMRGDQIPQLSRIVQICDAWVAMTDADTYQKPEPPEAAVEKLRNAAGSQFDAELCSRFIGMVRKR